MALLPSKVTTGMPTKCLVRRSDLPICIDPSTKSLIHQRRGYYSWPDFQSLVAALSPAKVLSSPRTMVSPVAPGTLGLE
jgi:hypothetical protein